MLTRSRRSRISRAQGAVYDGMRYLSVCSGIEAVTVAWRPLGFKPVAFAEIDRFPSAVLKHHYPDVPNWGDLTKFREWPNATIDVLVGGTPCQSFSVAGLRAGLADPRGNLALTYLACVDRYRPEWVVWENVPGVLSATSHTAPDPCPPPPPVDLGCDGFEMETEDEYRAEELHAFYCFLAGLSELGYGWAYRVLDAQYFHLAQRRARVFVVGHLRDWRRAAAVLFERESLSGHPAPRRETREGTVGRAARSVALRGRESGATAELGDDLAHALRCAGGGGDKPHALIPSTGDVAHSLRADGFDASEDGTGRGTPLIPIDMRQASRGEKLTNNRAHGSGGAPGHGVGDAGDPAFTVSERGQAIAFSVKDHAPMWASSHQSSAQAANDKSHANGGVMPAVAFDWQSGGDSRGLDPKDTAQLQRCQVPAILQSKTLSTLEEVRRSASGSRQAGMQVRRLTPRECERLMGFPDDYTLIPYRGKPAADGPRYKALGNSMAVPVMRWIGRRIKLVSELPK